MTTWNLPAWKGWAVAPHGRFVHFTTEPEQLDGSCSLTDYEAGANRRAFCGARVYLVDLRPANPAIAASVEKCSRCQRGALR